MFGKICWFLFLIICSAVFVIFCANTRNYITCKGPICETYSSNLILKTVEKKNTYNVGSNRSTNLRHMRSNKDFRLSINDSINITKVNNENVACIEHTETEKSKDGNRKRSTYLLVPARDKLHVPRAINSYNFSFACEIDRLKLQNMLNSQTGEFTYVFWGNTFRFLWYIFALLFTLLGFYILIKGEIKTKEEMKKDLDEIPEEYRKAGVEKMKQVSDFLFNDMPKLDKNIADKMSQIGDNFNISIDINKKDKD